MQSQFRYHFLHVAVSLASLFFCSIAHAQDADGSMRATLISMVIPLVIVVAAMVLALVFVRRRFGLVSGDGPMRVRQILAVGPRERVILIDVAEHTVVVGVTASNVSQIAMFPRLVERAAAVSQ